MLPWQRQQRRPSVEPDDRDFAFDGALVGRGVRLFGRDLGQHADLVEICLDEAFLGKGVQGLAYGSVVVRRLQHDVQVDAFAGVGLVPLPMMMKIIGPSKLLSLSGVVIIARPSAL